MHINPPGGLKCGLSSHRPSCPRAVSVYQQCPAAYASDTRVCNEILLQQATVGCLVGSDTPLIDHYRRCLLAGCQVDTSAFGPTFAYIHDTNCGKDGQSQTVAVVSYLTFRVV